MATEHSTPLVRHCLIRVWSTVSKALDRSINSAAQCCLLSINAVKLLLKKKKKTVRAAVVLQFLFLNPDWKSDKTLFTLKINLKNLLIVH